MYMYCLIQLYMYMYVHVHLNVLQEHGQRVWSVAYNPQEPTLFASGSDDCTVKLWSMGKANSIFSLSARANICSVKFNPHSRYMLAYGSAGKCMIS